MCGTKLRLGLRSWSASLSALTRTTHRFFHHCMILFVCKWTPAYGQCQMWYSEAPEWVGCAITQVLYQCGWQTTVFVIPFMPCLQSTWYLNKRASSKLQQAVLWKFNQKPLPDFWIGLHSEFLALANRIVKTLMPFETTYLMWEWILSSH